MTLHYRRVREQGMEAFKDRLAFSSEREVLQSGFEGTADANLLLPDLVEIWEHLSQCPSLGSVADIQKGFEFINEVNLKGREVVSNTRRQGWLKAILRAADNYNIWELPKPMWIDGAPPNFRRLGAATKLKVPQVVLNYAPVARQPWRLKAVIDDEGLAISSRFLVFRTKPSGPTLRMLWAVLNSPLANAYAYCFSGKRETLVKEWRAFPVPRVTVEHTQAVDAAVSAYLTAVNASESAFMQPDAKNDVKQALLSLDAEVLKLYDLSMPLERQLLDLFGGVERKGVGCDFRGYYPSELSQPIRLSNFLAYEADWPSANRRRSELVDRAIDRTITASEAEELESLQAYADYYLDKVSPRPTHVLEALESRVFGMATVRRTGV